MAVDQEADQLRRAALGAFCRVWRDSQGLSTRAAAERVGIAHSTWRLLERGSPGRPKTYRAIEQAAGLPAGMIFRALADDAAMIELAGRLGIEVPDDQKEWPGFINSYALPTAWAQQLASQTAHPEEDLPAVGALVAKLSARRGRTPTEETALKALAAWLAELTR